jgi:hypothetical protein
MPAGNEPRNPEMPQPHLLPDSATPTEPFMRHLEALLDLRQKLPAATPPDLRRRLTLAIQVASSPCCPESQADGVPCGTAETSCDHCARALKWIERVRGELEEELVEAGILARDPSDI